jgi:hypothetical protein
VRKRRCGRDGTTTKERRDGYLVGGCDKGGGPLGDLGVFGSDLDVGHRVLPPVEQREQRIRYSEVKERKWRVMPKRPTRRVAHDTRTHTHVLGRDTHDTHNARTHARTRTRTRTHMRTRST